MNHILLEHYLKAIPKLKSGLQKDGSDAVGSGCPSRLPSSLTLITRTSTTSTTINVFIKS